jgi:hypothetical protein
MRAPPTAFISYSHDDNAHRDWVYQLAKRLRGDGVDVTLDQWALAPGDQLPLFMESAVRENQFVLIVCTPRYKKRSDLRIGGVGYEGDIMTAEALSFGNRRKFLPILRRGEWKQSAPTWLLGSVYIDLALDDKIQYKALVRTLHGIPPEVPALGVAWNIEACRAAQYLHNHHFSAHRGAILWYSNVVAIFGNDGFSLAPQDNRPAVEAQQRTQAEVAGVRKELAGLGIEELGFGTDHHGYSWVLLAKTSDVRELNDLVWKHYPSGGSNNRHQQIEAFDRLWSYWSKPFNDQTVDFGAR